MFVVGPQVENKRATKAQYYTYPQYQEFAVAFRELIEQYPLYKHIKVNPPALVKQFVVDAATLQCHYCKGERTFRTTQAHAIRIPFPGGGGVEQTKYLEGGIYPIQLECQDCRLYNYYFQYPVWLPAVPKDIADENKQYAAAMRELNKPRLKTE